MKDIDKGFWMKIMEKATEGGERFATLKNCMLKYIERRLDTIIQSKRLLGHNFVTNWILKIKQIEWNQSFDTNKFFICPYTISSYF